MCGDGCRPSVAEPNIAGRERTKHPVEFTPVGEQLARLVSEVGLLSLPKKGSPRMAFADWPLLRNAKVDDAFLRSTRTRSWSRILHPPIKDGGMQKRPGRPTTWGCRMAQRRGRLEEAERRLHGPLPEVKETSGCAGSIGRFGLFVTRSRPGPRAHRAAQQRTGSTVKGYRDVDCKTRLASMTEIAACLAFSISAMRCTPSGLTTEWPGIQKWVTSKACPS